jgi:hypothetical protein
MTVKERYKPTGYEVFHSEESLGLEVFISNDGLYAMGFRGKAVKPSFHYRFKTVERTKEYISEFIDTVKKTAERKLAERAAKKSIVRDLVIGDVLVSSWGYEQTNIDYYQVTALVGEHSVELRSIGKEVSYERQDYGQCVPVPNVFYGEAFTKRVVEGRVRLTSYSGARKKDYQLVGGIKVFKPDYWSSYA